jgi:hypothetical protein
MSHPATKDFPIPYTPTTHALPLVMSISLSLSCSIGTIIIYHSIALCAGWCQNYTLFGDLATQNIKKPVSYDFKIRNMEKIKNAGLIGGEFGTGFVDGQGTQRIEESIRIASASALVADDEELTNPGTPAAIVLCANRHYDRALETLQKPEC